MFFVFFFGETEFVEFECFFCFRFGEKITVTFSFKELFFYFFFMEVIVSGGGFFFRGLGISFRFIVFLFAFKYLFCVVIRVKSFVCGI